MEEDAAKRALLLLECSPTLPLPPPSPHPPPSPPLPPRPASPPPSCLQSFGRRRAIRFTAAYDGVRETAGTTDRWSRPAIVGFRELLREGRSILSVTSSREIGERERERHVDYDGAKARPRDIEISWNVFASAYA